MKKLLGYCSQPAGLLQRLFKPCCLSLFLLLLATQAYGVQAHESFSFNPTYNLVSSTRVTRTLFDYTYSVQITNNGTDGLTAFTAGVKSRSDATRIIDGDARFSDIAAGATATSLDTITIRQDRTIPFKPSNLVWTVRINRAPKADAGDGQTVATGTTVILDGSESSDPDGDSLSYTWKFVTVPTGSAAQLSNPTAVTPSFVLDRPGAYVLELVVNDGKLNSKPDRVTINTENTRPVADAGARQTVRIGQIAQLDGSRSSDVDGDALSFTWNIKSKPVGSTATLSDPKIVNPTLAIDKAGNYVITLVVNDGKLNSVAAQVILSTENTPPVANAGPDKSIGLLGDALLDGSASTDVDGDKLSFLWSLTSKPTNSSATLSNPVTVNPKFTADLPGDYIAQLIVNDGKADSQPDTVKVTTENSKPVANAGPDQTVPLQTTVLLDGSLSTDAEKDPITYLWSLTKKPTGSAASLSNPTLVNPQFLVDLPGSYLAQLIVNDGKLASDPDTVAINTANSKPVANAGIDLEAKVGDTVKLDGSASKDADNDPLAYQWSFTDNQQDVAAVLSDAKIVNPTFVPHKVGLYIVQLMVNDGEVNGDPDTVQVNVTAVLPINQVPQFTSTPVTTATVGALYSYDVNASDADVGDTLTYSLQSTITGMVIDPSTGIIQWTPVTAQVGNQDVAVQVQDNHGAATSQSFLINVTAASIAIPDVTSKTQDAAAADILAAGLTVGTITTINSDTVPSGAVISQTPVAGTKVPNGTSVNLVISLGPSGSTDTPFEKGASLIGHVVDAGGAALSGASFTVYDERATGTPRPDVSVGTGTDGSFRLKLTSFPQTEPARSPAHHLIVVIDAPGTLRAYREAYAHPGDTADIGTIKLIARDPQITNIGPAGGKAQDSQGLVEVVIPPGALTTTIPVQITPLKERDQFPAPLPDATLTMYGFILEPHGTQFQVPVTVRTANYRNLPTTIELPSGYYNDVENRWEHAGIAKWDGSRFTSQILHFSTFDHNAARISGDDLVATYSKANDPNQGANMCGVGSSWSPGGGSIEQSINLPATHVRGEDFGISLHYSSGLAASRKLGEGNKTSSGAIPSSGIGVSISGTKVSLKCVPKGSAGGASGGGAPGQCSAVVGSCGGGGVTFDGLLGLINAETSAIKIASNKANEASFGSWIELPLNENGQVPPSGLFTQTLDFKIQGAGGGSCAGSGGTFGVADPLAKRVQLSGTDNSSWGKVTQKVLVQHRMNSPYGFGWAIEEISRVYASGDTAVLVHGNGQEENFSPRAFPKPLVALPRLFKLARDPKTKEILLASDAGEIASVNPETGATTTIISGLSFSSSIQGFAVAYVGNVRRFVVALNDQLVEINGGNVRTLATRTSTNQLLKQPSVTANNNNVFYTDAIGTNLYKINLADTTPTLQVISRPTAGDISLYPKGTVSTVTFTEPRGLAFDANGTLYMADIRRNAVYAILPESNGEIGPNSRIQLVMGDGAGAYLMPMGERASGPVFPIREPLGLSIAGDGNLLVITAYGTALYDPLSHEAEWLVQWANVDELAFFSPTSVAVSMVGIDASTIIFSNEDGSHVIGRMDIKLLSSERDPTRTINRLAAGGFELTDTTQAKIWKYDSAGRLTEQRKRTGEIDFTVSYVDAQSERIDRMTNAVGGQTVFTYSGGKLNSIKDSAGRVIQINISGNGDLVSLKQPDNEVYSFVYDGHRMTDKTAPSGDLTQYTYAADGTASSSKKPGGENYSFLASLAKPSSYDANGKEIFTGAFTDARGIEHSFQTNRFGEIEKESFTSDGVNYSKERIYVDELINRATEDEAYVKRKNTILRTSHMTLNGAPLSAPITYDSLGRPAVQNRSRIGAGPNMHRWLYDSEDWLAQSYDGLSNVSQRFERDAAGHILRIFDVQDLGIGQPGDNSQPTGREMKFTWRPDGQLATSTVHGVTTSYSYDDTNGTLNLKSLSDTLERKMTFSYDANGNLASASDGTSSASFVHDANNRMTQASDALGNITQFEYARTACGCSENDLVTGIHTPDLAADAKWKLEYGPQGRLAILTDPLGKTESYTYEPTGEIASLTDRLGRLTKMNYDHLGRLLSMDDTAGRKHQQSYSEPQSGVWVGPTLTAASADATLPPTSLTGALAVGDYQIGINALDTEGFSPKISLYRDATFELGYNHYYDDGSTGRLLLRTDRTNLPISSADVPRVQADGEVKGVRYTYDVNSSLPLTSILNSSYSAPAHADSADFTRNVEFDIKEAKGFRSSNGNNLGGDATMPIYTYSRDIAGRVTGLARHYINGLNFSTTNSSSIYAYRPDGRVGQVGQVGQVVNMDGDHNFTYDERGQLKTQTILGEGTYSYQYDALGRNNLLEFPDGHVRRQQYDLLGRINQRCYEYPNVTSNRCYGAEYDAEGNPTKLIDPEGEDRIEYDALDRVSKVTRVFTGGSNKVETYAYNALGALKTNAGVALDHQRPRLDGAGKADSPVPNSLGGKPVTLDKGGRVTALTGTGLTWDKQDHLFTVTEPAPAVPVAFKYDSYHRRIGRFQGGDQEFYVYEGDNRVGTINASNQLTKETYLFDGIDHPLRMQRGTDTVYYELDLAGNVRRLRGLNGLDMGGYRYTAFGETLDSPAAFDQPLRWKGRWYQNIGGTEIYDVRARQWAPALGTFLSIDEYAYHDANSTLWGWPNQNPVKFRDPSGKSDTVELGDVTVYGSPDSRSENAITQEIETRTGQKLTDIALDLGLGPATIDVHEIENLLYANGTLRERQQDRSEEISLDEIITPHPYLNRHFVRIARYGKKREIERDKAYGKGIFDRTFIDGLISGGKGCLGLKDPLKLHKEQFSTD
jgi:RHS repeat-associated protein